MVYFASAASQNEHHITVCIPNQSTWLNNRWQKYTWVSQDFFLWTVPFIIKPKLVQTILLKINVLFIFFHGAVSMYHTGESTVVWCSCYRIHRYVATPINVWSMVWEFCILQLVWNYYGWEIYIFCLLFKGTQDWDFFWLRFWNLYYFFISYVKILRFYKKKFLIRPLLGKIRFFRLVWD